MCTNMYLYSMCAEITLTKAYSWKKKYLHKVISLLDISSACYQKRLQRRKGLNMMCSVQV